MIYVRPEAVRPVPVGAACVHGALRFFGYAASPPPPPPETEHTADTSWRQFVRELRYAQWLAQRDPTASWPRHGFPAPSWVPPEKKKRGAGKPLSEFVQELGLPNCRGLMPHIRGVVGPCSPQTWLTPEAQRDLLADPIFVLSGRACIERLEEDARRQLAGALVPLAKSTPPPPNRHTRAQQTIERWVLEAPPILVVRAPPPPPPKKKKKKKKTTKTKANRRAKKKQRLAARRIPPKPRVCNSMGGTSTIVSET